ncbi:LOW QUALITY PROTEIN: hypothetical protein JCM19046_2634 [Bacillus sp. JCM 19046]|nr:LOW QUALITY PROTEIN: hypothetical protein JCM19045_795 [Bacillus sp. JCM 19045]GAF18082.1 LOW QUALITY PROTEIN: hypothetical protein JCM19046_2634 [Bacillus sp. JCM 19046]
MRKIVMTVFIGAVCLFTLLGTVLVIGQLIGLVTLQGGWVSGLNENVAKVVYFMTSIAAFAGYLLSYFKKKEKKGDSVT